MKLVECERTLLFQGCWEIHPCFSLTSRILPHRDCLGSHVPYKAPILSTLCLSSVASTFQVLLLELRDFLQLRAQKLLRRERVCDSPLSFVTQPHCSDLFALIPRLLRAVPLGSLSTSSSLLPKCGLWQKGQMLPQAAWWAYNTVAPCQAVGLIG